MSGVRWKLATSRRCECANLFASVNFNFQHSSSQRTAVPVFLEQLSHSLLNSTYVELKELRPSNIDNWLLLLFTEGKEADSHSCCTPFIVASPFPSAELTSRGLKGSVPIFPPLHFLLFSSLGSQVLKNKTLKTLHKQGELESDQACQRMAHRRPEQTLSLYFSLLLSTDASYI